MIEQKHTFPSEDATLNKLKEDYSQWIYSRFVAGTPLDNLPSYEYAKHNNSPISYNELDGTK